MPFSQRLSGEAIAAILVIAFLWVMISGGKANPTGGILQQGGASWSNSGPVLTVNQTSDRAVINWNSFSIGAGETTRFNQPSSGSAVLNRVVGSNLSAIYGNLSANGQVFLINTNGIIIGAGGVIKTSSFLASSLDVDNAQFMGGNSLLFSGSSRAAVQNLGKITATGGDVHLIAQTVRNDGSISAPHGSVGLGAGTQVLLQQAGQEKLFVQPTGANGTVVNSGTIRAINAELKADNGNVYAMAIQNTGVVRATGVARIGGHVYFTASGGSKIVNSGTVIANGSHGGGTIDVKAAGDIQVTSSGLLQANATKVGNGGTVNIISSGGLTDFEGKIEATGRGAGSIGGNAEVSGMNLRVLGLADLSGPAGDGTLLYDPGSIEILSSGVVDYFNTFLASTIATQLATASVTLSTANATNGGTQNITLDSGAVINWSSGNTLTLLAGANIIINGSITNTGSGSLVLHADNNAIGGPGTTNTYAVTFGTAGGVDFSGSTGSVSFYYNPTSYNTPAVFTSVQVNMGASPANFFPFMLVSTTAQLQSVSSTVNLGGGNLAGDYALGANIDLSSIPNFTPIGNYGVSTSLIYNGVFNGNGYTISNLTISAAQSYLGLFGYSKGTIENLTMTGVNITSIGSTLRVGGIVGLSSGTVKNVSTTGAVSGFNGVGGLVGYNSGTVVNAFSAATVLSSGAGTNIGGLVGINIGTINQSYATGTVTGDPGTSYSIGGLTGGNSGTVNNSYATGDVSGYYEDGGLVGSNGGSGLIENSYATGNVTGYKYIGGFVGIESGGTIESSYAKGGAVNAFGDVGGLVGNSAGLVQTSYADETVIGHYDTADSIPAISLGGLVGFNEGGTVKTSYALGTLSSVGTAYGDDGGLVGENSGIIQNCYSNVMLTTAKGGGVVGINLSTGTVTNSYAAGAIPAGGGGILGDNQNLSANTITGGYWDSTTTGATYAIADQYTAGGPSNLPSNAGATSETTAAMMTQSTFSGWDFSSTWGIQAGLTRPYLLYQPVISGTAMNGGGAVSGLTVNLVDNGTLLGTALTGASGGYAKVFNPGDIAAGTGILALSGDPATDNASAFGVMPVGFNSLTSMNLTANTFTIASVAQGASNRALATALGGYAGGGNVFTTGAGNSITLNSGISLLTTPGTGYTIDGNLTTAGTTLNAVFNGPTTIDVNLGTPGGILNATFNGSVTTGTGVTITAGTGMVDFGSTLTLGGALNVATTGGITLGGNILDSDYNLTLNGPVTTTANVTIGNIGNITGPGDTGNTITFANKVTLGGNLTTIGGNLVVANGVVGSSYNLTLRATDGAANLRGAVTAANILVTASGASGDVVLNSGATVTAMAGTSQDLILAAADAFQNNAGSAALNPNGGTWLVYSNNPDIDTFGSLNSNNQAIWNQPYTSINPAVAGDRYIFTNQPILAAASTDDSKFYGQVADLSADYSVNGFANASSYGNVFIQDMASNTLTGAFTLTSPGSVATASVAGSPYTITIAQGTEASVNGYAFSLSSTGKLTVNPLGVNVTVGNASSIYGTNPDVSGVTFISASAFANGQSISNLSLVASTTANASTNAGTYVGGITASSSNNNYAVTYTNGTLLVNQALLNFQVSDSMKNVGEANPSFTGAWSGFVLGQNPSVLTGALLYTTAATYSSPAGNYAVVASGLTSSNYFISYSPGTLSVVTPAQVQSQMTQQDYALFSDEVRFSPKASFGKGILGYEGKGWNVGPSLAHGSSWSLFR